MKVNKAKIRRDVGRELADSFIASGLKYGCDADVNRFVHPAALEHAKKLLSQGTNLSKSNYGFAWVGLMADMFETTACIFVKEHFYPSK